jgi:hypothetical protein
MALKDIRKAREMVADYLIAYVGEKAVAGNPHFDAERKVWSVPVLCYTKRGIFLGGKIELDEKLEIIYAPSKSEFTRFVVALERGEGDTILDVEKYWGDATVHDIHEQIMAAKANGELVL